jgi:NTE family protein
MLPMNGQYKWLLAVLGSLLLLGGCASRPVNPPIEKVDADSGYRLATRQEHFRNQETLVVLAFSGGGTRAAAFSYGLLEFLRKTEILRANGERVRLLDAVGVITGVSGGSFTALAYGLYGDQLFTDYEQRFLKRDVQGMIIGRAFNPANWGNLTSTGWGRSELAADLYDEILFNGATFADLDRGKGPLILASATDISTGARLVFDQTLFDALCSDLNAVRLSRAAAASSAVPVVLSPVTFNNYGGTCNYSPPPWLKIFADSATYARTADRAKRDMDELLGLADGANRPYLHLFDGGVADNLGMRAVLSVLELTEALYLANIPSQLDKVRRIVVFVVNSLSVPKTYFDKSEKPPGIMTLLLKASGVPIDHFSYETMELLKDTAARWQVMRKLRHSAELGGNTDPEVTKALKVPDIDIHAIDVSFAALKDKAEFDYLNELPTSFVLPDEAVDRLRAAAGGIVMQSPEFHQLLQDIGAQIIPETVSPPATGSAE